MSILYLLIPLALVLAAASVGAFIWAVQRGEYDDLDTPAISVLLDDEPL